MPVGPMRLEAEGGLSSSEGDEARPLATVGQSTRRSWTRKAGAAAAVGALLLLAPAASRLGRSDPRETGLGRVQGKDAVVVVPDRGSCSADKEDCSTSKCCRTSGHTCWRKDSGWAECSERCPSSQWSCWQEKPWWATMPAVYKPGTSLYCFSVYVAETAQEGHPSHDLELLQAQSRFNVSLFGCGDSEVFSDVDISLEGGHKSTKLLDPEGEFHALTRIDKPWKFVNTPIFYQVWKAIRDHGKYQSKDYTVKVDPQTVFLPSRLSSWLATQVQTERGNYWENCKNVDSGFFGNIEVFNLKAMTVLLDNVEDCKVALCWRSTEDCRGDWKFGPWGEDLFAQRCMDRHGVAKLTNFNLTISGTCPANRPADQKKNKNWVPACSGASSAALHPFKTPHDYFGCLGTLTGALYL